MLYIANAEQYQLHFTDPPYYLRALSSLLGIVYTLSWSLSFYPQLLLNIRRRSTLGTTPSFPILNMVGFLCYTISTSAFLYAPTIQRQYKERHNSVGNTTRGNDLAFALHSLIISIVATSQFWSYLWGFEQRKWRIEKVVWLIIGGSALGVSWMVTLVLVSEEDGWQWLDVIYAIGYVKLVVTLVKYAPQAYFNYMRRSTIGWAIQTVLMDLTGGVLSIAQLFLDSWLQKDWSGVVGNPVKFWLGNVSILFDALFLVQHYVLYRKLSPAEGLDRERDGLLDRIDDEATSR